MEIISRTLDFKINTPSVITLGKFDGIHRGHELLMEELKNKSVEYGFNAIVFTFDVPPSNTVNHRQNKVLTTNEEKHALFSSKGVDYLIECPFTPEIMNMEPEDFIKWIVQALTVKYIVVGDDFRFGHNRAGDYNTLKQYADTYGYQVIVFSKIKEDGRDISSTFVREQISSGNIAKANHLLGYEFFIKSEVVHGKKIGRTIGIPTINMVLPSDKLLPPFGVYVTRVNVGEKWYMGVTNVGCKPTIGGDNPVGVETYIIDFCQDVYGQSILVQFLDFIRPEMKFSSIDELKEQMNEDIVRAQRYYRNVTGKY